MACIIIATEDTACFEVFAGELGGDGHEVHWAISGHEAVELVSGDPPDLLLLDTALSVFDAYETCQMLRGDPDIPVRLPIVLLSDNEESKIRLEHAGFTEVFPRTHGADALRELVGKHAAYRAKG